MKRLLVLIAVLLFAATVQARGRGWWPNGGAVGGALGGEAVADIDLGSYNLVLDSLTLFTYGGADGDALLTNNAGTQGVTFNTSTTDGSLFLYDETGTGRVDLDLDTGILNADRIVIGSASNDYITFFAALSLYADTTFGSDELVFKIEGAPSARPTTYIQTNGAKLTFAADPGDASKTATALIPDGATVIGFSSRVATTGTNCTSVDIGIGLDTDMFANDTGIVDNDTTDNTDVTAIWSSQSLNPALADTDVIVTGVGGNCFDLVIDVHVHYLTAVGPGGDI